MRILRSCPRPAILSRAFSRNGEGGASLRVLAHLDACASCQREWAAMTELRNLSRSLPGIATPAAVQEEVRTALLLRSAPAAPGTRLPRALWIAIPVAVGAAAVMLLSLGGKKTAPPVPAAQASAQSHAVAVHRARVHSDDGATFTLEQGQPDEVVRLREGSIVVDVEPLAPRRALQGRDEGCRDRGPGHRVPRRGAGRSARTRRRLARRRRGAAREQGGDRAGSGRSLGDPGARARRRSASAETGGGRTPAELTSCSVAVGRRSGVRRRLAGIEGREFRRGGGGLRTRLGRCRRSATGRGCLVLESRLSGEDGSPEHRERQPRDIHRSIPELATGRRSVRHARLDPDRPGAISTGLPGGSGPRRRIA